jgi:hypothetical protein
MSLVYKCLATNTIMLMYTILNYLMILWITMLLTAMLRSIALITGKKVFGTF